MKTEKSSYDRVLPMETPDPESHNVSILFPSSGAPDIDEISHTDPAWKQLSTCFHDSLRMFPWS